MSNKKTAVAAAVALAVVAYGGTTWYTGQRAEAGYKEAVAELRKVLGEKVVVTDEYHKGFLSSQAKLVLQWPAAEAQAADAAGAADAARSEEHTSELQSPCNLVCRLLLEKKKQQEHIYTGSDRLLRLSLRPPLLVVPLTYPPTRLLPVAPPAADAHVDRVLFLSGQLLAVL